MYINYSKNNRPKSTYVGLKHAPAVDAESLSDSIVEFLTENGLTMDRVVCFCSVGASVMTGCKSGVGVRLQELNPFAQCVHCIAHRLALCCADSADDMDYPDMAESVVNNISSFFNRSGKRVHELQRVAKEFGAGRTKIVKSGKTRWLSRAGCVEVLLQLFVPLIQLFQNLSSSDDVAAALHQSASGYLFVGVVCGMADLLALLATLSQSFQHDTIDYSTVQDRLFQVRSTIVAEFLTRQAQDGESFNPNLSQDEWDELWNRVLSDGVESVFHEPTSTHMAEFLSGSDDTFRGVDLTNVDHKELHTWLTKFALAVMSRLAERFPEDDMKILSALEILNPLRVPTDPAKLASYGNKEVDVLCAHYGTPKKVGSKICPPMIDPVQFRVEWRLFKHSLVKMKTQIQKTKESSEDLIAAALDSGSVTAQIKVLLYVRIVLALNTSMCERGFSRMKLIKSALRNRIYIETLDALMCLSLVGPDFISNRDDAVFEEALKTWNAASMRNPRKARFGNKNATKRRAEEVRTELPTEPTQVTEGDESGFELDEHADRAEDAGEDVFQELNQASTVSLVPPFQPEAGFQVAQAPQAATNKFLKGKRVAYKFETEWLTGTFRGEYKGRDERYTGLSTMYFDRKNMFYLDFNIESYGSGKDWVIIVKK
jgi:hypothetical protein